MPINLTVTFSIKHNEDESLSLYSFVFMHKYERDVKEWKRGDREKERINRF